MSSVAYARFTFFEAATQHGFVVALMAPRLEKSRHKYQIVVDPTRGRVFQLYRVTRPGDPVFEFVIPERTVQESQQMWRVRCERELTQAWNDFQAARTASSGPATEAKSESTPSSPTPSSTDAPPASETSNSELTAAEPESTGSDLSPQSGPPSTPSKVSSRRSKKASKKTA